MSSPEEQERIKEEVKGIKQKINIFIDADTDPKISMVRTLSIYAGLLTETLLEYEEPDIVMEQVFHRISDLVEAEPYDGSIDKDLIPLAYNLDHDVEIGRALARRGAKRLNKDLDGIHEIAIGLIIDDVPRWDKKGYSKEKILLLLIEMVIAAVTFEMATQDFCDMLIEEFMSKGDKEHSTSESLEALSVLTGHYLAIAKRQLKLPEGVERNIINVMVRESLRHGTPGSKNWKSLAASNDSKNENILFYLEELNPKAEEFFDLIGQDDPLGRVVSLAKAVGRMVAVISIEDVGQIHPNIVKALAETGFMSGLNYEEEEITTV